MRLALSLFACALLAAPQQTQKSPAPQRLSPTARAVLQHRMQGHSRDILQLVRAVVLLEYDRVAKLADSIAEDSNLARPLTGDATELNSQLPERFFKLQDELKASAHELSHAAHKRDWEAVSDAYGRMSRTCVRCHQSYLSP